MTFAPMTNIPVPLSTHRFDMNVETSFCFLLFSILCLFILIFCLEPMNGTGGGSAELEAMKQDILREMRKEIAKAKLEIIEGGVTWHSSSVTLNSYTSVAFQISESVVSRYFFDNFFPFCPFKSARCRNVTVLFKVYWWKIFFQSYVKRCPGGKMLSRNKKPMDDPSTN